MTDRHISDGRQRRSKKYLALHAQLAREIAEERVKRAPGERHHRHQVQSDNFRQQGGS